MPMQQELERFAEFLIHHGATILDPASEQEAMRYQFPGTGIVILHRTKNSLLMRGCVADHYLRFREGRAPLIKSRPGAQWRERIRARIIARDGDQCCFCGGELDGDESIEHWLSLRHGGNNTIANTSLAHVSCNRAADSMSVAEKINLKIYLTAKRVQAELQEKINAADRDSTVVPIKAGMRA